MLIKLFPIVMCFLMFSISSFSQSYSVYIKNGDFIDDYNYKFDVVLKANENSLELTCYQGAIVHKLPDDNNIIFKYINGSSQLSNKPVVAVGLYNNSNDDELLTFASSPGQDIIEEGEKRIGTFQITSDKPIRINKNFLYWNFEGSIKTVFMGSGFVNITSTGDFSPAIGKQFHKPQVTGTEEEGVIKEFELFQNFPNPFNPSTTIKYNIPLESNVKLKVFNVLGEEVTTLVDQSLTPGSYEVQFDAANLPSGYYIYSLYVNDKAIDNKKMILVK